MKSLAHPDWPYTGTPHEWRGFVPNKTTEATLEAADRGEGEVVKGLTEVMVENIAELCSDLQSGKLIYQKQNFGPELK
jgi:hypothetical protein